MRFYGMGQAARLLGVSADTVRRWADGERLPTRRDEAGKRQVAGEDLAAFAVAWGAEGAPGGDLGEPRTSARNAFPGIITKVTLGDVAAQVEIQAGPHRLVSLVTREAVEELGLAVGEEAVARVKATSVHVDRR
ncbi:TOBE domain-containing protein [Streptomyces sedi]|uniref:Helix-turn-helix domain-containing protein n=1 Tax=Streptomyces sedi TaxID=555059 RepID=A0A5C4VAJ1_9ACTN|nr:TOBE domain-containing protein [Streptomyces sedi]TNM32842.1 helix-turn-helix domain-containing protein [Streptomyces sedi]